MHHPFETRRATVDATRRNAIDRDVIGPPSPRPQIIAARKHRSAQVTAWRASVIAT
jgi:hypothetical protein